MSQEGGAYAVGGSGLGRGYNISPRRFELGGGWNLALLENGQEAGGRDFPIETGNPQAGMDWWNGLTEEQQSHWIALSLLRRAADAYHAYLAVEAYADARNEGEAWMEGVGEHAPAPGSPRRARHSTHRGTQAAPTEGPTEGPTAEPTAEPTIYPANTRTG